VRIYLPPDANSLLCVADHCLRSVDYLNAIVIDKQPQLQYLTMPQAREHCARGAGIWQWCSNCPPNEEPDLVLACAGDIPTLEAVAAAWLMRKYLPAVKIRVVNVVDLMCLAPHDKHPHGMDAGDFARLFTVHRPVVFAFHGYPGIIHQLIHGRPDQDRFHVRGYMEEGTTTTPFDMVVLNKISRVHLCMDMIRHVPRLAGEAPHLLSVAADLLEKHRRYVNEHFEDLPEINDWVWTD
jgi:xylulose-5-phosphate/fructose-6-phosphate phosphoketolase